MYIRNKKGFSFFLTTHFRFICFFLQISDLLTRRNRRKLSPNSLIDVHRADNSARQLTDYRLRSLKSKIFFMDKGYW